MPALEKVLEKERVARAADTPTSYKERYGQYFTPYSIANFMASLFPVTNKEIKLLDPGAGIGTLACSFLERIKTERWRIQKIHVSAYEVDKNVLDDLKSNLNSACSLFADSDFEIFAEDFLEKTSHEYVWKLHKNYTHIIMNPPYKKIRANSSERISCRAFGLETVNLYAAFMGAAISLAENGGYIAAIIPRSFCSGAYYKPFREFILKSCAIRHIHLFEVRDSVFKDDDVLQENIIMLLQKNTAQENVKITYSKDSDFTKLKKIDVPFSSVLNEHNAEKYFNIPTEYKKEKQNVFSTLDKLNAHVSTGPVVDFRMKESLLENYVKNSYPLAHSVHFRNYRFDWPKQSKKPNAIRIADGAKTRLFPKGFYVVVKRFSTKEEKKRIVASLIVPDDFAADAMTFENHLNVFHFNKKSLQEDVAYGLLCWLNSTYIDKKFRLFNGHTQVNATDLRNLPYLDFNKTIHIGKKLKKKTGWTQETFDSIVAEFIT